MKQALSFDRHRIGAAVGHVAGRPATWWGLGLLTLLGTGTGGAAVPAGGRAIPVVIAGNITNLRSARGHCYVTLFDTATGFPYQAQRALRRQVVSIRGQVCRFRFEGLRAGRYALAVFHDENDNGRLDKNALGLPTEGYAFSNNPRLRLGPPSFATARFLVGPSSQPLTLILRY